MAVSNVELRVNATQAVTALKNVDDRAKKFNTTITGTSGKLKATAGSLKPLPAGLTATGAGATAAASGFTTLTSSIAPLIVPLVGLGAAFHTLNTALRTFSQREADVAILTQGLRNLGAGTSTLTELQKAADILGKQTLFDQEDFTRGFNLLTSFRNIGVDAYTRVAQSAADIAEVNQVDVSTSFMQLAKALQDPERNLSNLNRSGIAFTKTQTDVIKELMKTNKVAEAHDMILKIVEESYDRLAQAAATGLAGATDSLGESFRDLSEVLGEALNPALTAAVEGLTSLVNFLNSEGGQTAAVIAGVGLAVKGLSVAIPFAVLQIKALLAGFSMVGVQSLIASNGLTGVSATSLLAAGSVSKLTVAVGALTMAANALPLIALASGFVFLTNSIIKAINKQKEFNELLQEGTSSEIQSEIESVTKKINKLKEAKARADKQPFLIFHADQRAQLLGLESDLEKLQKKLSIAQGIELFRDFEKSKNALKAKNKELKEIEAKLKIGSEEGRKQFDLDQKRKELTEKFGKDLADQLIDLEKKNKLLEEGNKKLKKQEEAAKALKQKFMAIGQDIEKGIVSNLADAVEGTKTLAQAAVSVLNDLKRKLIEVAIQQAVSGIGGKIGGFLGKVFGGEKASGGQVAAGKTFLVGENGPELLSMGTSRGFITPNNQISGGQSVVNNITVNVDASGSSVQGNDADATQFGEQLAAAIQAEIINQKRSGGLLN